MSVQNRHIVIGGAAGQGLVTVGQMLSKGLVRAGYEVLVTQDYMSRVRGGHNTYNIRTGVTPLTGPAESIDILVALNQETVSLHKRALGSDGILILDEGFDAEGLAALHVPFASLAPKAVFQNIAALGVLCSVLGLSKDHAATLVHDSFGKKGQAVIAQNLQVLDEAYAWGEANAASFEKLPSAVSRAPRMFINGNESLALGALAAGVKFCSFYPMTPATSIAQNLITHGRKMGVYVEQVEDEIAALNMGLGASYAGAPTLIPTSGGGFALMTEAVSLAGVMEQPVVVVVAQRPGPATGLPTRTEQADFNLVLYAGHGEFPRAIFAPGTIEDCFFLTRKAFDISEKYQSPVFVLTDQELADRHMGVEPFDLDALPPVAGPDLSDTDAQAYKRYVLTKDGLSPRRIPGYGESIVLADCHEHTEDGHITEDIDMRIAMNDKRMLKEEGMRSEVVPPRFFGADRPDTLLLCWGSTEGAAREAANVLNGQGQRVGVLSFTQVWPLAPEQFLPLLETVPKVVCVEGNKTAQFARLLRQETGFRPHRNILRYDGRPFTASYIIGKLAD
ncbi:2-oxoacid:acceptor oxidoreductase subunit alpha [Desulfovibrio mangrovi]|uniref:2-oxoacid:acceptor oxidoreductase subunit alpha n=1 Tax=Desulfovibrio mangrovi TaxID=2976983 RepID=UPI0022485EA6|nr:2-oxoacid:acceptor oxidoreductase subunit alpha [Desulfovibrio mangrovi]UZP68514.1 2-oxoacid:acceptor oxidoreductase subunit alpha [Desulfovibrio mangrovi]